MDVDRLPERRLAKLLDAIKAAGFAGANITYPFKQDVIALLDTVDQEAAQIAPSRSSRMAALSATISIDEGGAMASRKASDATVQGSRWWWWSARAAPGALSPLP
jgi:hypothetical protein